MQERPNRSLSDWCWRWSTSTAYWPRGRPSIPERQPFKGLASPAIAMAKSRSRRWQWQFPMKQPAKADADIPEAEWRHRAKRWSLRDREPTTICYADLCRYADGCTNRTIRPKRIAQAKCPRYWPETLRPSATLSRLVRGLLTQYQVLRDKQRFARDRHRVLR